VVGAFYIRRIARIYPALWIASSLALLYVIASHTSVFGHPTAQLWVTQYRDRTMSVPKVIAGYLGIGTVLPIPTWSIFAELLGSAIIPLILLLMRRGPLFLAAFAIALLLISLTIGEKTRMFAGVYIVSFVFGASILQWQTRFSVLLASDSYARASALVALVFLLFIRQIGPWSFDSNYHAPVPAILEGLSATVLIAAIVGRPAAFTILRLPTLVWLGDISYSLYLLHVPVILFTAAIGGQVLGLSIFNGDPLMATIAMTACTLVISVVLAAIAYRFVEIPGMRAGSKISRAYTLRVSSRRLKSTL